MRKKFNLLKFNFKLIYRYCIYNYKFCEPFFEKFIFTCDLNLKTILLLKRSLLLNRFRLTLNFYYNY